MRKTLSVLLSMSLLACLLCLPAAGAGETAEPANPFTDVSESDWFYDAVKFVTEQGLMEGSAEGQFEPGGAVARGQIIGILHDLEDNPTAQSEMTFADVPEGEWYTEAVRWAASEGIVAGYSSKAFGPEDPVTREQMAVILWRYARYQGVDVSVGEDTNILSYSDAFTIGEWAYPALQWACGAGVINERDGALAPTAPATRAEAAAMLMNFCGLGQPEEQPSGAATLLYLGHGSLRVVSPEGKVIYIDPYAGDQYDLAADLILVTHGHPDHTKVDLITERNEGCQIITHEESNLNGDRQSFDLGYVKIQAVEAGNNPNHDINVCVGYVLTFSDGKTLYVSGDTSTTDQMAEMGAWNIDYAFFCCDGNFNMDVEEASACAALVDAKHSIPYHMAPGSDFSQEVAEQFQAEGRIILEAGAELALE